MLGAALLARYETVLRPQDKHWSEWYHGQMDKVRCGLDQVQGCVPQFDGRVAVHGAAHRTADIAHTGGQLIRAQVSFLCRCRDRLPPARLG